MKKTLLLFLSVLLLGKVADVRAQACKAGTIISTSDSICYESLVHLTASGSSGNLQWQKATVPPAYSNITGATSATYNGLLNASSYFRVIASGTGCSDTSAPKFIYVTPAITASFTDSVDRLTVSFFSS